MLRIVSEIKKKKSGFITDSYDKNGCFYKRFQWRFDGILFHIIIPKLVHLILFSIETDKNANIVQISRLPSDNKI